MKRLFALLLLILSLGMQPIMAADDPTYTYIQFSGNGRTVLLDTDGALSVVNATENAPSGSGYQWTFEAAPNTTASEVVLKSKAGHYVVYNTTDKSFTTTTDATAATAFTKSTNTYYSATAGSTRYDLSISSLTGKNALAVKNGQLTLAVTNSRYSTVRLATTISGPNVNPMVSTIGDTRLLTQPHVIQFTAQGAQALYDSNTKNNVTVKTPADDDNADGYTWQFEAIAGQTDAYALKSKLGHYLKYTDNAFSTTSNADEAVALFPLGNDYDPYHTRISLTLANDATKAIGYKDNVLYLSDAAASLYTVTRMVESTAQVVGTALPKFSTINDTYYYKLQFKANHAGDDRLTLTDNGYDTPTVNTEANPANMNQNWILKTAVNPKAKEGDFYLVNQMGEFLCYNGSKFVIRPQYNEKYTTVYRFMQNDTQPTYWMIDMPLNISTNHTMGLRNTDVYKIKECEAVSDYNYLSFKPSTYVSEYNYLEFTGNGRTALFEKDGALIAVATTETQPIGDGYQWTYETAEQNGIVGGIVIKSKAGHYVKYDATTKTFSSVANKTEASIFVRSENTYYTATAGATRYNYTLYGNTDPYNTLGVKNGQLQLVRPNSRYAVVRRTTSLRGALFCPMVSTDDKPYYYHIDLRTNGDELLQDANDGEVLQKTTETLLPLKDLRWSIYEANDWGDVYIKSFKGHYIYCDGTDQRVTADPSVRNAKGCYKLCDIADNTDSRSDGHWLIYNYASNKTMKAGGVKENKVVTSNDYSPANRVRFTNLGDTIYRYLLFPAMGMKPLLMGYNDKGQVQLRAHTINSQDDQPGLYQWRIDGHNIGNKAGYFITYNDKDKTFGVTTNKEEAYQFEFSRNTYENNNLMRDNLLSTDEQHALCIDEDGTLSWGQPNTRYSVAHLRSFPLAPKLPVSSANGVHYQLYYLQTQSGSHYNYTLNADNTQLSLQPAATDDLRQLWVFVNDGRGTGDYYLQSAYNRAFLKYDATAKAGQQFAATTNIAEATHVRLVESNTQPNYWQLQLVGAGEGSNIITHNYTNTTGTFALTTPNNDNNFVNLIAADITPEFYDEEGGTYRNLQLKELDTPLQLVAQEDGSVTTEADSSTNTDHNSWKNVGSREDFVLRNANGKYLTTNSEGAVILTDKEAEATHFFLWLNHPTADGYITWMFGQLPPDGQVPTVPDRCLGYDEATNSVKLLPFSTYITDKKHTLCFTFSAPTSPALTTDGLTGKNFYYFAHFDKLGNQYMSDGDGTSVDAIVEGQRNVNDQMWAFVGPSKEDFVVMSKDKYYLYFNPTKLTFDVTHDLSLATHFSATYRANVDRYTFTLVGGIGTERYTGWLLAKSGNSSKLTLNTEANMKNNAALYYLRFEEIAQPEDYSDYEIRPKRSWFVKLAHEAQTSPMTGFIQRDEEGWTINPYTKRPMQKTSTYTITHYLKCQSTHDLYVPTCMVKNETGLTHSRAYQRWYNYKTDEAVNDSVLYLGINSSRKYSNGLVVGARLNFNGGYGDFVGKCVTFQMPENVPDDWEYILGADLTTYTDFVDYFGDNGNPLYTGEVTNDIVVPTDQDLIEPTVTGRNIFVIRNARAIANQLLNYREGSKHWLEEKTITFPRKKVTLKVSTVNLDMQKSDYWFYKAATAAEENLQNAEESNGGTLEIVIDDSLKTGITSMGFQDNGLSSASERAIGFKYPDDPDGSGTGKAKADQCELKVYGRTSDNIRYQIAKFTLKFENDFEPILYTEVIGKKADGSFKSDRSPEALKALTGNPVATITFDPDPYDTFLSPPVGTNTSILSNNGQGDGANTTYSSCYRYPFNYDNTSYCFTPADKISDHCTWGNYTISKEFNSNDRGNFYPIKKFYKDFYIQGAYDDTNAAFLYIDASDLPGQVASIDFSGQACTGSRLYVSAWMSSPNFTSESPANVVFRVEGITESGDVNTLYSYCPGGILGKARDRTDKTIDNKTDNKGIGLWQQVFFSFINKSTIPYTRYRLTIDNACTNTQGGDILIDDIEVFSLKPSVQLERSTPVCSQQITLAKMTADFDVILQQLDLTENEDLADGNPNMWYCLLDKALYDKELTAKATDPSNYTPSTTDVRRAFTTALVGDPAVTTGPERAFRYIEFTTHFNNDALLPPYDYAKALHGMNAQRFKETSGAGDRHFIISDKFKGANLQPRHEYYILFKPRFSSDPITINNAVNAFELGTDCCIMSTFRTGSAITVVEDGDDDTAIDNEVQTCAGKSVALSVKQNGTADNGTEPERLTQYDWWRDYVAGAFTQIYVNTANRTWRVIDKHEAPISTEITLREALMTFRHFYPTATTVATAKPQSDGAFVLTQPIIDVLLRLTQNTSNSVAPLLLLNNTCNVFIPMATTQGEIEYVTVIPIDHTNADGNVQYCYDPERISILVSGKAPQLFDGLNGATDTYPDHLTNVPIRTSLAAVSEVREQNAKTATAPNNVLRIPLRRMVTITDGALGMQHILPSDSDLGDVYITATNDPTMEVYKIFADKKVEGFRTVGHVKELVALSANPTEAHADIYFLNDFNPREGYTYTLRIDFRERFAAKDATVSTACDGTLLFDLIIVPQYEVWTGAAGNTDWTNDANWARADRTELLRDAADAPDYVTNAKNGTAQGFAPMSHTNVIVTPQANGPLLYATDYSSAKGNNFVHFIEHEGDQRTATPDIEYHLLTQKQATEGGFNPCSRYGTYQANNLVLQSGSELLHPERLTYTQAWVEYALTPGRWYTLGSPLQHTYAGDWYAPTDNAQQLTPYFDDVTFNTTDYNRFAPAVYQRSWDKANSLLYYLTPYSADAPQQAAVQNKDVYQAIAWSKTFNDVQTPYGVGGFSVKVNAKGASSTYTQSLFRLPKEDTKFGYYTTAQATDGKEYTVDRTKSHRLIADQLNEASHTITQTLTNKNTANAYFLVSNPFTCGLDMNKFFSTNAPELEGAKYWLLTADGQLGVMQNADDKQWITVNDATATTAQGVLAPDQGFFVKAAHPTGSLSLRFTADMMTSAKAVGSTLRAPARRQPLGGSLRTLRIRAARGGLRSEAIVVKDTEANNDYQPSEDLEALVDNALADVPTVYTLAGTQASTINRRHTMFRVPLGILSNSDAPTRLTFMGLNEFNETLSLLDEQTGLVTPLTLSTGAKTDSVSLEVSGNAVGRYYILSSAEPTPDDLTSLTRPLIQVDNQRLVITSSPAHPLTHVEVVDAAGRVLYQMKPFTSSLRLKLPQGIYVVEARTDEGKTVNKVTMPC
uniref:T9SS type A sorting domain-containing protein n=1 Tax=Alloprevotella sp. TaxID=1872471 RepID=UPI003FD7EBB3